MNFVTRVGARLVTLDREVGFGTYNRMRIAPVTTVFSYAAILAAMCFPLDAYAASEERFIPDCAGTVEVAHATVSHVTPTGGLILPDGRALTLEGIRLPLDGEDALAMRMMALMLDDLGVASCVSVADDDEWLAHRLRTGREVVACLAVGRELHLDRMAELSRAMKQLRIVILTSAPVVDSAPVIGTGACVGSMGAAVDALLQLRGPLTAAEASALRLAADGYTNVRIARELGVSVSAIKSRLEGSYSKLRAADRTHAVAIALRQHWIR